MKGGVDRTIRLQPKKAAATAHEEFALLHAQRLNPTELILRRVKACNELSGEPQAIVIKDSYDRTAGLHQNTATFGTRQSEREVLSPLDLRVVVDRECNLHRGLP